MTAVALWGAVLAFFFISLDSSSNLSEIMTGLELKVEKLLYIDKNHCLLEVDKDGHRVKIVMYPPVNVVLDHQLEVGGVCPFTQHQ